MQHVELRDLLGILEQHPKVSTLIFTGGNSKNGPEYFFRQLLKKAKLRLVCLNDQVPRKHQLEWAGRVITTYSLTAPLRNGHRAIGSMDRYKKTRRKTLSTLPWTFGWSSIVGYFLTNKRNEITNLIHAFFF